MGHSDQIDNQHPLFLDLLRTLQRTEDEESALNVVVDTVAGAFHPKRICFIPERGGLKMVGNCGHWTAEVRLLPDQMIKLLPSKKGFVLALKSQGKRIGLLLVDEVSEPRNLNAAIPFILTIPDALDMALSNIRHLKELNDSRARLSQLSESLGVANKILRHDISNELLVVSSSLELYKTNDRERDLLRAQDALHRMQGIISQMRELDSFLLSHSDMTAIDLVQLIDKVLPSLEIAYKVEGEASVLADPALNAVIENLVRNAKKHGNASNIEFIIRKMNDMVTLTVRNDGKPIPDDQLERVFMEGVAYGGTKGTGLGLYLVKRTMERYGGRISVDNDPHGGVRFDLTFRSADIS
jgi:signal transduction histidine kinase